MVNRDTWVHTYNERVRVHRNDQGEVVLTVGEAENQAHIFISREHEEKLREVLGLNVPASTP